MNESFGDAMINLAAIYFANPYSSISSQGYQPSPALLKYNMDSNELVFDERG